MLKISEIPGEIKYIIVLFVSTRVILTIIGLYARANFEYLQGDGFFNYTQNSILNIWGVWDSRLYLDIAHNGYSLARSTYAIFPLYPLSIKALGWVIGNNFFAGIIISNVSFIIASVFLYKLAKMETDSETALKSIKYLFLFPTAFVFSGILNESLFLALILSSFYCARKENWFWAGILGFFASLTKQTGTIIILPLLYEYLAKKDFKFEKVKKDIAFLFLPFAGLALYSFYNYYMLGDFIAFMHLLSSGWGTKIINPLTLLYASIFQSKSIYILFNGIISAAGILILIKFYRKIRFSYWIFSICFISIPLSLEIIKGMSRYLLIVFPFYILLAKFLVKKPRLDIAVSVFLAMLQAILMIYWTNGSYFTI